MLNSRFCAGKNRKLRSGGYQQILVRFFAQIEFLTQTNLRLNEPEIIEVLEFKRVLNFEHGSGNSK